MKRILVTTVTMILALALLCAGGLGVGAAPAAQGLLAWGYRDVSTNVLGSNGTSLQISVPTTGGYPGDLLLAVIATDGQTTWSTQSGWQSINQGNGGANGPTLAMYYRVATASEPANYTFSWTGSEEAAGAILRYSGVDTTTPIIDDHDEGNGNATNPTAPASITSVANALVVRVYAADDDDLQTFLQWYPANHTGRLNIESSSGDGTCSLGVADRTQATAGNTGTAAFALSYAAGGEEWRAATIALRPRGTTAVELVGFEAKAAANSVALNWETAAEIDNLGYNLYRAETADGPRIKLNDGLIPTNAPPGSNLGAAYAYEDAAAAPGATYYYWLEDVDLYGGAELHGPAVASLDAGVPMQPGDGAPRDAAPARKLAVERQPGGKR